MEIYLIRHAETVWNIEERLQGWSDSPLSEKGRKMSEAMSIKLRDISFDKVYSSDLGRAKESVKLLVGNRNISIEYRKELRELALGKWEGLTFQEVKNRYPEEMEIYFNRPDLHKMENCEDYFDLQRRIRFFLKEISKIDQERILIVAHGVSVQAILNEIEGVNLQDFWGKPLVSGMDISQISYGPLGYSIVKRAKQIEGKSY